MNFALLGKMVQFKHNDLRYKHFLSLYRNHQLKKHNLSLLVSELVVQTSWVLRQSWPWGTSRPSMTRPENHWNHYRTKLFLTVSSTGPLGTKSTVLKIWMFWLSNCIWRLLINLTCWRSLKPTRPLFLRFGLLWTNLPPPAQTDPHRNAPTLISLQMILLTNQNGPIRTTRIYYESHQLVVPQ